jgi:hypothetical protein
MYLSQVRVHRARRREVDVVLSTAALAALPRDEQRRLDLLAVHVGGQLVALIDPGREAQSPTVIWQHPELSIPAAETVLLIKQAVVLMDGARSAGLVSAIGEPEASPSSPTANRPGPTTPPRRGRARQVG